MNQLKQNLYSYYLQIKLAPLWQFFKWVEHIYWLVVEYISLNTWD